MSVEAWREFGLCGQTDPELFFSEASDDVEQAKGLCGECPSKFACLRDSLANGEDSGIRGGLTADERKELPGFVHVPDVFRRVEDLPAVTDEAIAQAIERKEAYDERRAVARRLKANLEVHPLDREVQQ